MFIHRKRASLSGFTLVELAVVSVISIVVLGVLFTMIMRVGRMSFQVANVSLEVQQQLRQGMENMVRELYASAASRVSITDADPYDQITFQVPVGYDGNGDILWGADGSLDYSIRYLWDGEQLLRRLMDDTVPPAVVSDRVLANNIQSLSFAGNVSPGPEKVIIEITAEKTTVRGRTIENSLNSQVTFRN